MGGYGSGRQYGRPLADEAKKIDLAWMIRSGMAVAGQSQTGNLSWTCRGEPAGNIGYTCDMRDPEQGALELRYTVTDRGTGEECRYVQNIRISFTRPHLGGKRWWMHCPVNGERVGKLYCPNGAHTFASRKAYRLGYHSQRVSGRDKPFEALFRIQRRLGCSIGWEQPIRRPKGMWRRTYARLEQEYWRLDRQCSREMGIMASRLSASIHSKARNPKA